MTEPSANNWRLADIGTLLVGAVLVCGAVGYGLDTVFHSKPWGLIGGVVLGFAAWLWQVWKTLNASHIDADR